MSYSFQSNRNSSVAGRYQRTKTGQRRQSGGGGRGPRRGQYIDPARFVKAASMTEAEAYVPIHKFTDFALNDLLQANLAAKGYIAPSPVQDQTISYGLEGKDIIGIASTGTGKTAAFALPVLDRLMSEPQSNALIIAPTRELAQQIEDEFKSLAKGSGLSGTLLIGGTNMGGQLRDLTRRPRVVIGTPGRIKDHLERQTLKLNNFNMIVLDEVDRMLDMGFIDDVTQILSRLHDTRQSFFFSATMDVKVRGLINSFTHDPIMVSLKASSASESVHQNVIRYAGNHDKVEKLHELLLKPEVEKVIVFDETQRSVERLSNELIERGFSADAIHGGKSQGQRQRALNRFKKSEIKVLVATDVAARGIDVVDITHVVNFSLPQSYDDYVHRIGRAGRAGKTGYALTFIN